SHVRPYSFACCISSFFIAFLHPRDLHSFPTRRSSDLLTKTTTWSHLCMNSLELASRFFDNKTALTLLLKNTRERSLKKYITIIGDDINVTEKTIITTKSLSYQRCTRTKKCD